MRNPACTSWCALSRGWIPDSRGLKPSKFTRQLDASVTLKFKVILNEARTCLTIPRIEADEFPRSETASIARSATISCGMLALYILVNKAGALGNSFVKLQTRPMVFSSETGFSPRRDVGGARLNGDSTCDVLARNGEMHSPDDDVPHSVAGIGHGEAKRLTS